MGIDGIEFHPRYQQNLGTFQEVWLFQKFFSTQKKPHPGQITFWKYNGKSIFWNAVFLDETLHKKNLEL